MNILYISFFFLGIFHFCKTASINEASNTSVSEKQNIDNSEHAEQKTSIVHSENEGNIDSSNDAKDKSPLPKNPPNTTQPKIDKKGDNNNCEKSQDKANTTNPKEDTKPHPNQPERKKVILVRPFPRKDDHESTNQKEQAETSAAKEQSESKASNSEHFKKGGGSKSSKHKRKHHGKGYRYNTVRGINKSDIDQASLETIKERPEDNEKKNPPTDDKTLDLSKKKT
ncbi:conserved Plasmodium protein, unknown function [Plasmodium yoelii]|uniref:Uncharacterized protein n=3 Tax=Plasmodium yoelii TaxID=5861 RepID=A0AAE9WNV4_PLAYO|nr:conserved Plasmodium protein, unknown function [Plasmodium yoelii]EAA19828.1 hypothetical protein [Plasmodium yoelii yoelii]WBY55734.1 hypothetical protein Py17XNL_000504640 [Plasmodium yoelii yoelii]CDU16795.1 conserved Plasmodium protein, unknown function [Plasmodium yoelii]VTZ74416.1 conserved Plasmodium protein, unknown function [Plasmodium yoelii]|eukprot:XP_728263.1 conserved Plasmodium protein, unknown function [Plasmodium yoelii]